MTSYNIPASVLLAIVKAAASHADDTPGAVISGILLEVDEAAGELTFVSTDGYRLYRRTVTSGETLAGQYPNYRQILPAEYSHAVTVDRRALLAACKAMPGRPADGRPITLNLNGKVDVTGFDKLGNPLSQSLPVQGIAGPRHPDDEPEVAIRFNAGYLGDALVGLAASRLAPDRARKVNPIPDTVTIRVNGPCQAADISAGEESGGEAAVASTLLMPIRT